MVDTKDKKFLAEINLASLVSLGWKTLERYPAGADQVEVTVNYEFLTGFLNKYGRVGSEKKISFFRPESFPSIDAIDELVRYRIDVGDGSGYIGLDDFNVAETKYVGREDFEQIFNKIKYSNMPY